MSYLLDKKTKRNSSIRIGVVVIFLFIIIYFRAGIFHGFSVVSSVVFRPALIVGHGVGGGLSGIGSYFNSKKNLLAQNEALQSKLAEIQGQIVNYNSLLADDVTIKEALGRKSDKVQMILAGILAKPNQSAYDTMIVDAGSGEGVVAGSFVFADGNVPIGKVDSVYPHSSKIILFSNTGQQTEVSVSLGAKQDAFMQLVGRGGGNFEMSLPRDVSLPNGTTVVLPGITPYVVGTVQTIISDPRDAFQKALLVSPVNIEELKFVQIVK